MTKITIFSGFLGAGKTTLAGKLGYWLKDSGHTPLLVADERVEQHLYNGCPTSRYPAADGRYRVRNAQGQFLGLANITGGVLRVEKLFVERN